MVAFGHTAVGASVGLLVYESFPQINPILGLSIAAGAGIVSHYITDFIPHGHFIKTSDFKKYIPLIIIFDLSLSIAFFLFSAYLSGGINLRFLYILFGIGGSQLPDVLDGLIYIGLLPQKGLVKNENDFHQWTHWHGKGSNTLLLGIRDVWQIFVVVLSFVFVFTR